MINEEQAVSLFNNKRKIEKDNNEKEVVFKKTNTKKKQQNKEKIVMSSTSTIINKTNINQRYIEDRRKVKSKFEYKIQENVKNQKKTLNNKENQIEEERKYNKNKKEYLDLLTMNIFQSFDISEMYSQILNNQLLLRELREEEERMRIKSEVNINLLKMKKNDFKKILTELQDESFRLNEELTLKKEAILSKEADLSTIKRKYIEIISCKDTILYENNQILMEKYDLEAQLNKEKYATQRLLDIKNDNEVLKINIVQQNLVLKPYYKRFILLNSYISNTNLMFSVKIARNKKSIILKKSNRTEKDKQMLINISSIRPSNQKDKDASKNSSFKSGTYQLNDKEKDKEKDNKENEVIGIYKCDKIITTKNNITELFSETYTESCKYLESEFSKISNCYISRLLLNLNENQANNISTISYLSCLLSTDSKKESYEKFKSYSKVILNRLVNEKINIIIYSIDQYSKRTILHEESFIKNSNKSIIFDEIDKLKSSNESFSNGISANTVNMIKITSASNKHLDIISEEENVVFEDMAQGESFISSRVHSIYCYILKANLLSNGNEIYFIFIDSNAIKHKLLSKEDITSIVFQIKSSSSVCNINNSTSNLQSVSKQLNIKVNKDKASLNKATTNSGLSSISPIRKFKSNSRYIESIFDGFDISKVKYSNLFIDFNEEEILDNKDVIDLITI